MIKKSAILYTALTAIGSLSAAYAQNPSTASPSNTLGGTPFPPTESAHPPDTLGGTSNPAPSGTEAYGIKRHLPPHQETQPLYPPGAGFYQPPKEEESGKAPSPSEPNPYGIYKPR